VKTKNFKKSYASNVKGSGEKGTWSGRAVGVPVGGAIGGGDGFKQKIGRNKIPWTRTGFKGSPSQAADAGFSSFLARVNKGHEDIEQQEMFPDQSEESSIENNDEQGTDVTRTKFPKYTGAGGVHGYPTRESKMILDLREFISEIIDEELSSANMISENSDLATLRSFIRASLTSNIIAEKNEKILTSDDDDEDDDKDTDEASGSGGIAGYTGPMSSPKNPDKFYKDMEKAYHGKIIGDIPKRNTH
jgi:hypothetical protein